MAKSMQRYRWIRKHGKEVLLAILFPLLLFGYSEYQAAMTQHINETHLDANFRAQRDIYHGGDAQPVQNPDGTYSVQFQRAAHENVTIRACVQWVITRANGTVQQSPRC